MFRTSASLFGAFVLGALTLAVCRPAQAQLTFQYTSFDPPGIDHSYFDGLSNTGVIVGEAGSDYPYLGLIYQNGVATTVSYPGAVAKSETDLLSINSAGIAAGIYFDASANKGTGFLYDSATQTFSNPAHANSTSTILVGINDAGQVAGNYLDASGIRHATIYDLATDTFTDLPDNGVFGSYAQFVAPNGDVLVNSLTDKDGHVSGSFYANGAYTTFNFPGAVSTHADAINANGLIVGNYTLDANEFDNGIQHGFVYQAGTFYSLDYPGATYTHIGYGLNDSNQIVGYYGDATGDHGLLITVTAVPEPGSVALLAGTAISGGLMLRRARKRRVS